MIKYLIFPILLVQLLSLGACKRNQFFEGTEAQLRFSIDTLNFDTVFTKLGNATKRFKVYNPYGQKLLLSKVQLAGGTASDFNINIDGANTSLAENIEIPANDSIYIYANVYIDPSNGDAIRADSILFECNGSTQKVYLDAYGWNAEYIGQRGYITRISRGNFTLSNAKPYIFLGYILIDSGELAIPGGTEIFMFGGPSTRPGDRATIIVGAGGSLKINEGGDLSNPVEIKTHRLEEDYQYITFHHGGIILTENSQNNIIHGTILRNSVDGVVVEKAAPNGQPKLDIKNSFIYNVDRSGILSDSGTLTAENLIIANSNQFGIIALTGGEHTYKHCTFVNYGNDLVSRNEPILSIRNYRKNPDESITYGAMDIKFQNCIVYGSRSEETEVLLGTKSPYSNDFAFDYCLMKVDTFSSYLPSCITNQVPLFKDKEAYDYSIDSTSSPALNAGNVQYSTATDALGTTRTGVDLGAYEIAE